MVSRNNNPKGIVFILFGMALFSMMLLYMNYILEEL